ncbi:hypothetical protein IRJ41_006067 [Triplophysa rosa]|uniref:Uncharacterized protein n=1 Tax=Triplophysa rosa TaxID=992332 RepID=A0A9W7TLM4_TRIRA|nr:hypothetical protein IRJ41_006067 [Triplophysa rosa]
MSDSEKSQLGMRTNPAPTSLGTLLNPLPEQIHLREVLPARLPVDEADQQQACLGFSGHTAEVGEGHRGYRDHRACLSPSVAEAGNYSWERRPQLDAICQRDRRARLKQAQRPSEVP